MADQISLGEACRRITAALTANRFATDRHLSEICHCSLARIVSARRFLRKRGRVKPYGINLRVSNKPRQVGWSLV
jgi:hypothetical protein